MPSKDTETRRWRWLVVSQLHPYHALIKNYVTRDIPEPLSLDLKRCQGNNGLELTSHDPAYLIASQDWLELEGLILRLCRKSVRLRIGVALPLFQSCGFQGRRVALERT